MHKWFSPLSLNEYVGILISYTFVFVIIGISTLLRNRRLCPLREAGNLFISVWPTGGYWPCYFSVQILPLQLDRLPL